MAKKKIINASAVGATNFLPKEQLVYLEPPKPSILSIPKWYKDSPVYNKGSYDPKKDSLPEMGFKACMPFFDAMSSGYIIKTWSDITISYFDSYDSIDEDQQNNPNIYWSMSPEPISKRDTSSMQLFPVPEGFSPTPYIWRQPWALKTPPGYSLLYTHPFNRFDLPFFTLSGIVDTDEFFPAGNIPFYLKKGFTGLIPAGTPIIQIIPIKRDSWQIDDSIDLYDESNKIGSRARSKIRGFYKNNFWNKKDYK